MMPSVVFQELQNDAIIWFLSMVAWSLSGSLLGVSHSRVGWGCSHFCTNFDSTP